MQFQVVSPVDGRVYVERGYATGKEIDGVLARAASARAFWKNTPIEERARYCSAAVDAFNAMSDQIVSELAWQMGRPVRYGAGEVHGFTERARYMIDIAPRKLADIDVGMKEGFKRFIRREPLGVVLVLAPWNYPYLTAVNSIIPALMAGNPVVLKHAYQTPLCAERIADAFVAAGLPEGVFQYLHADHDAVAKMVADPRVNFVAFTGSVAGGHAVQRAARERFIGLGLELGGKDPAYVRADANLNHAIENLVDGAMFNSGQSCCGIERIYVDKRVYEDFVEGCIALTSQYVLDSPLEQATTLGPVVRVSAAEFIREQIREAVQAGAKPLIDEGRFENVPSVSTYIAPQLLVNVDHSMRVMSEETFGPVVGIMPVNSDEEAIRLMNDSEYGLTAAIWTSDAEAAIALGSQLETGTVFMNRCDYLDPALAWTGVKNSGRGVTLSELGYEQLTQPKSFHLRVNI